MVKTKKKVEIKKLGTYKVKFKTDFDLEVDEDIHLQIQISEDLKDLIKTACLINEGKVKFEKYGNKRERFKVKSWLYNSINNEERDFIFDTGLLSNGNLDLKFGSTEYINNMVNNFKGCVKNLIDNVLRYQQYEVSVTYTVSEKNE